MTSFRVAWATHRFGLACAHRVQSAYDRSFSKLKADKKLRWLPHLGNVNMTIELKDRSVTVDATPVQAAVIELFDKTGDSFSMLRFGSMTLLSDND